MLSKENYKKYYYFKSKYDKSIYFHSVYEKPFFKVLEPTKFK
jgi:hypothetical protein